MNTKSISAEFDNHSIDQLKEHYLIEKELASKLMNASKQDRKHLYTALYDELFQRVPNHPQLTIKADEETISKINNFRMKFLKPFINENITFMELGPGDCALSIEVASHVKKVYAIDVSNEITTHKAIPSNMEIIISDGSSIPLPSESVDIAYSNQLMEHLHPDDAFDQLVNIYNALKPSGAYICITPNKLSGPHDVSRFFDEVATGFHLKEYTNTDLIKLFKKVGFSKVNVYFSGKGLIFKLPVFPITLLESILLMLPHNFVRSLAKVLPFRFLILAIQIVGIK